jgi:hypothetical protein
LAEGRLVRPFGDDLDYDFVYYIIHRPHAGDEPGIAAIKEWLLRATREHSTEWPLTQIAVG